MAYCIVVTSALVHNIEDDIDGESIFGFAVLYLIGALIYFVYEIITTKKWRNLISTLPGLGLIAALNLGFAVGLNSVEQYVIDQRPKSDEITSVSIGIDERYLNSSDWWDFSYYAGMKNSSVKITDKEVISIISYYLDENAITWESGEYAYFNKYSNEKYVNYVVTINTESRELHRSIAIPTEESDKIMNIIETIPEYAENWKTLPKPIKDTVTVDGINGTAISPDEAKDLLNTYGQELKEIPYKDLYSYFQTQSYQNCITYSFNEAGYTKRLNCPIYDSIMPKTSSAFYKLIYDNEAEYRNEFENMINSDKYGSIDFNIHRKDEYGTEMVDYASTSENIKDVYAHLSKYIKDEPLNSESTYAVIWLFPYDYNNETPKFSICLDEAILKDEFFKQYFEDNGYYYD